MTVIPLSHKVPDRLPGNAEAEALLTVWYLGSHLLSGLVTHPQKLEGAPKCLQVRGGGGLKE